MNVQRAMRAAVTLGVAAALLSACEQTTGADEKEKPAVAINAIDESNLSEIMLTAANDPVDYVRNEAAGTLKAISR